MIHRLTAAWVATAVLCIAPIRIVAQDDNANAAKASDLMRTYIGTYTHGDSRGIYQSIFNSRTGELSPPQLAVESDNPSFLAIHPNRRLLYAVNETAQFQRKPGGAVSAFRIDSRTGQLTLINQQRSHGGAPCHLVVDPTGRFVLVANYSGGNVAVLPIRPDGGLDELCSLIQHTGRSINPQRQESPHAHSINLDPTNRFAFAADLGTDKVYVYQFNAANGQLTPDAVPAVSLPPGSGPRHFALDPQGRFAFVINELKATLTSFRLNADAPRLTILDSQPTVPSEFDGRRSTAEVVVHPSGRFVYGSNRGHDSIAVFSIDLQSGKLTRVQLEPTGGHEPRNFVVTPDGQFLLAENQNSHSIHVFAINPHDGTLTASGHSTTVPSPVCIRMLPSENP